MNLIKEKVCSFEELYKAMHQCKKDVLWKDSVAGYVKNGLVNCYTLSGQLMDGTYKIDGYSYFTIHEPKTREIVSTRMKDRVFQRSLCDNYLYREMTKGLIYDNVACQRGKGTLFAMNRLNCHLQRYYREHGLNGYVLQCDIKNYFGSTRHDVAMDVVKKRVKNKWALGQVNEIICSFGTDDNPNMGMGLGSQVTQLIQLAVLDDMDHYIKEELKIKQYIRYMDDFILIHPDKEYLKYCRIEIEKKLEKIHLQVNKKKTQIYPITRGVKFLGFRFILTNKGKVIRKLNKDNISKERRKLCRQKDLALEGVLTKDIVDKCYTSWKAHAKKGNTHNLLKRMDCYYENLWKEEKKDV